MKQVFGVLFYNIFISFPPADTNSLKWNNIFVHFVERTHILNGFRGGKRPGLEADHTPPLNAEVKNALSYISTPPPSFRASLYDLSFFNRFGNFA